MGGFVGGLKELLEGVAKSESEKRMAQLYGGPNWRTDRRRAELGLAREEQAAADTAEEVPLRRAKLSAETEKLQAETSDRRSLAEHRANQLKTSINVQALRGEQAKAALTDPARAQKIEAEITKMEAQQRLADAQAQYFLERERGGGGGGAVVRVFSGYDQQGAPQETFVPRGSAVGQNFPVKPTAEQINTSQFEGAVGPSFQRMRLSLDRFKTARGQGIGGTGIGGGIAAAIPTTQANFAMRAFLEQSKALAANTARLAGEGSRLSDEDRQAYAAMQSIADEMPFILNEGAVDEAALRLDQAEQLLDEIMKRRQSVQGRPAVGTGEGAAAAGVPSGVVRRFNPATGRLE